MSKLKGNIIFLDDYIKEYGVDVFRMYLMFGFGYIEGGVWNDDGIKFVGKFVDRIERILEICINLFLFNENIKDFIDLVEKELNFWKYIVIKGVIEDGNKM